MFKLAWEVWLIDGIIIIADQNHARFAAFNCGPCVFLCNYVHNVYYQIGNGFINHMHLDDYTLKSKFRM